MTLTKADVYEGLTKADVYELLDAIRAGGDLG